MSPTEDHYKLIVAVTILSVQITVIWEVPKSKVRPVTDHECPKE